MKRGRVMCERRERYVDEGTRVMRMLEWRPVWMQRWRSE